MANRNAIQNRSRTGRNSARPTPRYQSNQQKANRFNVGNASLAQKAGYSLLTLMTAEPNHELVKNANLMVELVGDYQTPKLVNHVRIDALSKIVDPFQLPYVEEGVILGSKGTSVEGSTPRSYQVGVGKIATNLASGKFADDGIELWSVTHVIDEAISGTEEEKDAKRMRNEQRFQFNVSLDYSVTPLVWARYGALMTVGNPDMPGHGYSFWAFGIELPGKFGVPAAETMEATSSDDMPEID